MRSPVIVALDFESKAEAMALVDLLGPDASSYEAANPVRAFREAADAMAGERSI